MFDLEKFSEKKIKRGISHLDEYQPDWKAKVAPDLIEMKNGYPSAKGMACVLCQLFGSFETGLQVLCIPHGKAHEYGFDALSVTHWSTYIYGGTKNMFDSLNLVWKRAVVSS